MHILLINNDGVDTLGLLALAQALCGLGEVIVLSPDHNWFASGHVKTMHRPLRVKETCLADETSALESDSALLDCVVLALLGLVKEKIEVVFSGINPNANLGHDRIYSG
jgi:5'-nucleotidase